MDRLYTKNGRPLRRVENKLFARSGVYLGRIRNDRVFDPNGVYAGTIVGTRVVYRSTHAASMAGPSTATRRAPTAAIDAPMSALWGDEPRFSD